MTETQGNRFIPVGKWNQYHPWPSVGGLRHLIFFRKENGFERCIRHVGRRLLISESDFMEWMNQQTPEQRANLRN